MKDDGSPVYLLEAEPPPHLKSTDPSSFRRSQPCPFPNRSLSPVLVGSREDSQNCLQGTSLTSQLYRQVITTSPMGLTQHARVQVCARAHTHTPLSLGSGQPMDSCRRCHRSVPKSQRMVSIIGGEREEPHTLASCRLSAGCFAFTTASAVVSGDA